MSAILVITSVEVPAGVLPSGEVLEYRIDSGRITGGTALLLNNANQLNLVGASLAQDYCDHIAGFIKSSPWRKISDEYLGPLYLYTDSSVKRTEFFESFDLLCNVKFLSQATKGTKISQVHVFGENMFHLDTVNSLFPDADVFVGKRKSFLFCALEVVMRNSIFFGKYVLASLIAPLFIGSNLIPPKVKRVFVTRYPGRLSSNEYEEKYADLVREEDYFIAGILTDGSHQNLSFFDLLKAYMSSRDLKRTIVLDRYCKAKDALYGILTTIRILFYLYFSKERILINDVNYTSIFQYEFCHSAERVCRMAATARPFLRIFRDFRASTDALSVVYYLHEYGYGRAITHLLKEKFGSFRAIAMQHGPSSPLKLIYRLSAWDLTDFGGMLALPDAVLAEDRQSAKIYRKSGYKRVFTMSIAPRLVKQNTLQYQVNRCSELPALVAPGLHDGELLVCLLLEFFLKNPSQTFLIKFHPKAQINRLLIDTLPPNCEVVDFEISDLFQKVNKAYVTYSSVGEEALRAGIEVRYVDIPGRVSQRPLF